MSTVYINEHNLYKMVQFCKTTVKPMVFPVVMYGCESWTIKKVDCQRIELWCYRRLLRVPWIARRSNQSILKEINPECSLKFWCWSSNTLATWCEEPLIGKDPDAGEDWGHEENRVTGWDGCMASITQETWVWANSRRQWRTGKPGELQSTVLQRGVRLSNWPRTTL